MKYIFIWKEGGWGGGGGEAKGEGTGKREEQRETEWLNFIFQWWRYNTDVYAVPTELLLRDILIVKDRDG